MTFDEYLDAVDCLQIETGWRLGQAHFNILASERPDLSEQVRGNFPLDPFHQQDDDLRPYLEWVRARWDDQP
jgi:hypothetical protein